MALASVIAVTYAGDAVRLPLAARGRKLSRKSLLARSLTLIRCRLSARPAAAPKPDLIALLLRTMDLLLLRHIFILPEGARLRNETIRSNLCAAFRSPLRLAAACRSSCSLYERVSCSPSVCFKDSRTERRTNEENDDECAHSSRRLTRGTTRLQRSTKYALGALALRGGTRARYWALTSRSRRKSISSPSRRNGSLTPRRPLPQASSRARSASNSRRRLSRRALRTCVREICEKTRGLRARRFRLRAALPRSPLGFSHSEFRHRHRRPLSNDARRPASQYEGFARRRLHVLYLPSRLDDALLLQEIALTEELRARRRRHSHGRLWRVVPPSRRARPSRRRRYFFLHRLWNEFLFALVLTQTDSG